MKKKIEAEQNLSGWTPELGKRIADVISDLRGLKPAAKIAGVSTVTLAAWRDGENEARFSGLAELARAADKSLDWLAYGIEAPAPSVGGFSDHRAFSNTPEAAQAVGERLKRSRETCDAAVIAADYDPPKAFWEALRTAVFKYDISIDDAAQLIDAVKQVDTSADRDD